MHKQVLIHGGDETLLETRRQILLKDGLIVETVLNGSNLSGLIEANRPDLLVVCSSVAPELQQRDVHIAHAAQPQVKCVVIDAHLDRGANITDADAVIGAFDGPGRFVSEVRKLLAL
jgi:DNA-binding NtrC family response regulator